MIMTGIGPVVVVEKEIHKSGNYFLRTFFNEANVPLDNDFGSVIYNACLPV
jgi:hypothetical protein